MRRTLAALALVVTACGAPTPPRPVDVGLEPIGEGEGEGEALFVDVTIAGRPLRVYGTHLDFGADAEDARDRAARQLLAHRPLERDVVIGGDLNAGTDSAAVATFSAALVDLWGAANPSQAGLTFPATAPTARIDWLFASSSLSSSSRGARLLDERSGGVLLSDHPGVAVALDW